MDKPLADALKEARRRARRESVDMEVWVHTGWWNPAGLIHAQGRYVVKRVDENAPRWNVYTLVQTIKAGPGPTMKTEHTVTRPRKNETVH